MSARTVSILLCFSIALFLSCEDSINPSGPFQPRMVVYSVLTTQSDTQYVRVYTSYNPADNNPSNNVQENPVTDARVTMTGGNSTYVFRDTMIKRATKSKYGEDVHLYYCYPMRVLPNVEYTLQVTSPRYGSASASLRTPNVPVLTNTSTHIMDDPSRYFGQPVACNFIFYATASAYLVRLYIVYTAENPWEPLSIRDKEKYFEVPYRRIAIDLNNDLCTILYPEITRINPGAISRPVGTPRVQGYTFPFPAYNESIAAIRRYNFNVRFKRAIFYLVQFDQPFYQYYSIANLYEDKLGVRLDAPDYSNIAGASGLFASVRVDSSVWNLPEFIAPGPRGYNPVYCQQEVPQIAPKFDPLSWMRQ